MAVVEEEGPVGENELEVSKNIFNGMESAVLKALQDAIGEQGLGSEEGAKHLRSISLGTEIFADLISRLQKDTGLRYDNNANAKLTERQSLQENLEEMIQREKLETKTLGAPPIWRCGVCVRADKPWIACFAAPFLVRYEKGELWNRG
jgi:hypothetical protein